MHILSIVGSAVIILKVAKMRSVLTAEKSDEIRTRLEPKAKVVPLHATKAPGGETV
jgi:hypothetical protein